ncbi:MAG: sodium:calcium antiporter [Nitrospirae bacterium]|nr:sodium:calcium antiporter [Nitrospirota bacterium]
MRPPLVLSLIIFTLGAITVVAWHVSNNTGGTDGLSYLVIVLFLLLSMGIILLGCEIFSNGVECFGADFQLSHATAGSLLAAVGTALPETLLPLFAILFGAKGQKEGIAIGAILGAPFMLTTLAMFLLGVTTIVLRLLKHREKPVFNANLKALELDLVFFLICMMLILVVSYIGKTMLNYVAAGVLLTIYGIFIKIAVNHESEAGEEYAGSLHFEHVLACPLNRTYIIVQTLVGLLFITVGAHIFIEYITVFSVKSGISSLILSLLIAPLATELPEKFNSITWTIKKKDGLAMANISGAMVFQSTIPISIGLLFTRWQLGHTEFFNITMAVAMAFILLITLKSRKRLHAFVLLLGGVFYVAYLLRIFLLQ